VQQAKPAQPVPLVPLVHLVHLVHLAPLAPLAPQSPPARRVQVRFGLSARIAMRRAAPPSARKTKPFSSPIVVPDETPRSTRPTDQRLVEPARQRTIRWCLRAPNQLRPDWFPPGKRRVTCNAQAVIEIRPWPALGEHRGLFAPAAAGLFGATVPFRDRRLDGSPVGLGNSCRVLGLCERPTGATAAALLRRRGGFEARAVCNHCRRHDFANAAIAASRVAL
jgi:hypothetical protein